MGAGESKARLPPHAFHQTALLIQAPPQLFGVDLRETTHRVLHTAGVTLVRWDGTQRAAERHRDAVGRHLAVLYFFDPAEHSSVDIAARLEGVLLVALKSMPVDATCYACSYGHSAQPVAPARGASDAHVSPERHADILRQFLQQRRHTAPAVVHKALATEADLNALLCPLAMQAVPRKIARPLGNLLGDMAGACGATEAFLVDAVSVLPLAAWCAAAEGPSTARTAAVCLALRQPLGQLISTERAAVRFAALATRAATVFIGWAAAPYCYAVLLVPNGAAPGMGHGLVRHNMAHYQPHFSNVVENTTERVAFTPILPPE